MAATLTPSPEAILADKLKQAEARANAQAALKADLPAPTPAAAAKSDAEESRKQRERQQQVNAMVQGGFAAQVRQSMAHATVSAYTFTGAALVAAVQALAAEGAKIKDRATATIRTLAEALESAEADADYSAVVERLESTRMDKPATLQAVVRHYANAIALADQIAAELRQVSMKLATEAEAVVADVKQRLTEIGNGVESQPAGNHSEAASRQFNILARSNTKARAAINKAEQAKGELSAAVDRGHQLRKGLEEAKSYLRKYVQQQIAS
jgi:uncharacterized membrane-anchored protein YhcB (DUF1043 family)